MHQHIEALRGELTEETLRVGRPHAKELGDKLGVNWKKIDIDEFRRGIQVEKEHGRGPFSVVFHDGIKYAKIALAHLDEIPDYYTRLDKMEKAGKKAKKQ